MNLYFIAAWELLKSKRISKLVKTKLIVRLILLVLDPQASQTHFTLISLILTFHLQLLRCPLVYL